MLKVTGKTLIEQEVIKNLLSAHKRIAACGSVKEVIRLSRFLLRLAKKQSNKVLVVSDGQSIEEVIEEDRRDSYPEEMEVEDQVW